MDKGKKHYKANKRTYYLNLRSNDATRTANKFEWIVKNINLSQQARVCVSSMFFQDANNGQMPIIIRCPQVKNIDSFDSANGISTIICVANMLHTPTIENWYPLNTQNLDRIELYLSDSVANLNNGISNTMNFYVQLKIEDYSTEEVDAKLMPTYTRDSLSFVYPLNL